MLLPILLAQLWPMPIRLLPVNECWVHEMNEFMLGAAALAALFLFTRRAPAAQVSIEEQDTSAAPREADANAEVVPVSQVPTPPAAAWQPEDQVRAFLYMIRASEHRYPTDMEDAYNIGYGGARFYDFTDHPVITGELLPVKLPDHICAASGLGPGCVSTAAGAYQIIKPTWQRIRAMEPRLYDFSKSNQDEAAVRLLQEIGAYDLILAGDIDGALRKASRIWASLPYSTAGQRPKQLQYALDRYNEALTNA